MSPDPNYNLGVEKIAPKSGPGEIARYLQRVAVETETLAEVR